MPTHTGMNKQTELSTKSNLLDAKFSKKHLIKAVVYYLDLLNAVTLTYKKTNYNTCITEYVVLSNG